MTLYHEEIHDRLLYSTEKDKRKRSPVGRGVIKPCPFCGDKPYTRHWLNAPGDLVVKVSIVQCDCGAKGPERYGENSIQEAIDIWNKRAL